MLGGINNGLFLQSFGGFVGLALLILVLKWGFSSNMQLQKLIDSNIKATLTQTLDGPQLMVFEKDLRAASAILSS